MRGLDGVENERVFRLAAGAPMEADADTLRDCARVLEAGPLAMGLESVRAW